MPSRAWTPQTAYKRIAELIAESDIDCDFIRDDNQILTGYTLADLRGALQQMIVDAAVDTDRAPADVAG